VGSKKKTSPEIKARTERRGLWNKRRDAETPKKGYLGLEDL